MIATMRISTWNVNSLGVRLPQVLDWLAAQAAANTPIDVLALQELKLTDDKFPHAELEAAGYRAEAFGQKTYNGVALLTRLALPALREVQRNITGFEDDQARVIGATLDTPQGPLRIINGYFVNGQEPGSEKFAYKMRWMDALRAQVQAELGTHARLVLLGDYNIAPEDRDSHDPEGLRETIHHTTAERDQFQALLALGLHDAYRLFDQPEKSFSWWDYRMLGFQKNRGLRIDHILVSDALKSAVRGCTIDRQPRKNKQPSDHAPVVLELQDA
jgi:exodeoxyribonuclease-3